MLWGTDFLQDLATIPFINYKMQDKVIKEAVIIQNWIEDQSARNFETVSHLKSYVESLQKTIDNFVEGLEEGVADFLEDQNPDQLPQIRKLYSYLGRMVKELAKISKGVQKSLNKHVLTEVRIYAEQLEQRNIKIYQTLCTHYKETAVAYKMIDLKPDIQDIYNPILKQRDILDKSRDKYKSTLKEFEAANDGHLDFTKTHIITTIKAINELLNLDGLQKYLTSSQFMKPLKPQPVITELVSEIQYQLGTSRLLVQPQTKITPTDAQREIFNFVNYLISDSKEAFKNYEETRSLVLGNEKYSIFFMQQFAENLKLDVNLTIDKYHDVQSMIKFIFASMMETEESREQILINVLRVSSKVRAPNKWLLKELKAYQLFWKDVQLWRSLYNYVKQSKQSKNNAKHYVRKIKRLSTIKWLRIPRLSFHTPNSDHQIALQVIREVSIYLAGLEIDNEFVLETLVLLCKNQNISRAEIEKLIKYQHSSKKQLLNQIYEDPLMIKKQREDFMMACQQHKLVVAVGMSMAYLSVKDNLLNLRLVSREWNQLLTKDIHRRYMQIQNSSNRIKKYRLDMYLTIADAQKYGEKEYKLQLSKISPDFDYRQIILLDVKRSLAWNISLQPIMLQVLCLFAFNYPDTGYLQGMNYLVENLLKITQKPNQVYRIFEYLMRAHYLHYYSNNFAILRLRIYQLVRFIEMYIPQLARHFQKQKIQGQYYLLPWAITLWGQFSGELSLIMTDGFLIDGWIWWMKVCLWVLNENKQEFLQKRFEGIMKLFSQLINNKLLKENPLQRIGRNIKKQILSYEITHEFFSKIQKQYMCSNQQIAEMLEEKSSSTSPGKSRKSSKNQL